MLCLRDLVATEAVIYEAPTTCSIVDSYKVDIYSVLIITLNLEWHRMQTLPRPTFAIASLLV